MIYFAEAQGLDAIKIGFVESDCAAARIADLQVGCPVPVRLMGQEWWGNLGREALYAKGRAESYIPAAWDLFCSFVMATEQLFVGV